MKKFALLLVFGFWLFAVPLKAQETRNTNQFSLGIYPPIIEINAEPPASVEAPIQIQNLTDLPENLKIVFKSFRPQDTGDGTLRYINENPAKDGARIIEGEDLLIRERIKVYDGETPIEEMLLDPFESRNLKLKINLDRDIPLGDYYFSVIFLSNKIQSEDSSQSQIPGGIGTNVILSIGKKGFTSGEIKRFSAPRFLGSGPVPVTLLLQNNSDHYVVPQGRITIRDMFGRETGQINILPQYILANSQRYMIDSDQASESAELSEQIERLSQNHPVLIWPRKFLFGLYTASAHIKFSEDGPFFETKTTFVALPVYTLFAISFMAFVLIGIYLRVKKKI